MSWTHSTQLPSVVSHTSIIAEHCTSEVQLAEGVTHTPAIHTSPASQSGAVLHSTHTPRVALHTRSGHIRDEVHGVDVVQVPAMHVVPSAQSAARTHDASGVLPQPAATKPTHTNATHPKRFIAPS